MSIATFTLAALAGAGVSIFLSRPALDRLALLLGLLTLAALFAAQTAEALSGAMDFAWWAMLGFASGFTAVSLVRSARELLGRS